MAKATFLIEWRATRRGGRRPSQLWERVEAVIVTAVAQRIHLAGHERA